MEIEELLDGEVEEMWTALVHWSEDGMPPSKWRPDIELMANATVRRMAWLVESTPNAAACWDVFEQHVIAREQARRRAP